MKYCNSNASDIKESIGPCYDAIELCANGNEMGCNLLLGYMAKSYNMYHMHTQDYYKTIGADFIRLSPTKLEEIRRYEAQDNKIICDYFKSLLLAKPTKIQARTFLESCPSKRFKDNLPAGCYSAIFHCGQGTDTMKYCSLIRTICSPIASQKTSPITSQLINEQKTSHPNGIGFEEACSKGLDIYKNMTTDIIPRIVGMYVYSCMNSQFLINKPKCFEVLVICSTENSSMVNDSIETACAQIYNVCVNGKDPIGLSQTTNIVKMTAFDVCATLFNFQITKINKIAQRNVGLFITGCRDYNFHSQLLERCYDTMLKCLDNDHLCESVNADCNNGWKPELAELKGGMNHIPTCAELYGDVRMTMDMISARIYIDSCSETEWYTYLPPKCQETISECASDAQYCIDPIHSCPAFDPTKYETTNALVTENMTKVLEAQNQPVCIKLFARIFANDIQMVQERVVRFLIVCGQNNNDYSFWKKLPNPCKDKLGNCQYNQKSCDTLNQGCNVNNLITVTNMPIQIIQNKMTCPEFRNFIVDNPYENIVRSFKNQCSPIEHFWNDLNGLCKKQIEICLGDTKGWLVDPCTPVILACSQSFIREKGSNQKLMEQQSAVINVGQQMVDIEIDDSNFIQTEKIDPQIEILTKGTDPNQFCKIQWEEFFLNGFFTATTIGFQQHCQMQPIYNKIDANCKHELEFCADGYTNACNQHCKLACIQSNQNIGKPFIEVVDAEITNNDQELVNVSVIVQGNASPKPASNVSKPELKKQKTHTQLMVSKETEIKLNTAKELLTRKWFREEAARLKEQQKAYFNDQEFSVQIDPNTHGTSRIQQKMTRAQMCQQLYHHIADGEIHNNLLQSENCQKFMTQCQETSLFQTLSTTDPDCIIQMALFADSYQDIYNMPELHLDPMFKKTTCPTILEYAAQKVRLKQLKIEEGCGDQYERLVRENHSGEQTPQKLQQLAGDFLKNCADKVIMLMVLTLPKHGDCYADIKSLAATKTENLGNDCPVLSAMEMANLQKRFTLSEKYISCVDNIYGRMLETSHRISSGNHKLSQNVLHDEKLNQENDAADLIINDCFDSDLVNDLRMHYNNDCYKQIDQMANKQQYTNLEKCPSIACWVIDREIRANIQQVATSDPAALQLDSIKFNSCLKSESYARLKTATFAQKDAFYLNDNCMPLLLWLLHGEFKQGKKRYNLPQNDIKSDADKQLKRPPAQNHEQQCAYAIDDCSMHSAKCTNAVLKACASAQLGMIPAEYIDWENNPIFYDQNAEARYIKMLEQDQKVFPTDCVSIFANCYEWSIDVQEGWERFEASCEDLLVEFTEPCREVIQNCAYGDLEYCSVVTGYCQTEYKILTKGGWKPAKNNKNEELTGPGRYQQFHSEIKKYYGNSEELMTKLDQELMANRKFTKRSMEASASSLNFKELETTTMSKADRQLRRKRIRQNKGGMSLNAKGPTMVVSSDLSKLINDETSKNLKNNQKYIETGRPEFLDTPSWFEIGDIFASEFQRQGADFEMANFEISADDSMDDYSQTIISHDTKAIISHISKLTNLEDIYATLDNKVHTCDHKLRYLIRYPYQRIAADFVKKCSKDHIFESIPHKCKEVIRFCSRQKADQKEVIGSKESVHENGYDVLAVNTTPEPVIPKTTAVTNEHTVNYRYCPQIPLICMSDFVDTKDLCMNYLNDMIVNERLELSPLTAYNFHQQCWSLVEDNSIPLEDDCKMAFELCMSNNQEFCDEIRETCPNKNSAKDMGRINDFPDCTVGEPSQADYEACMTDHCSKYLTDYVMKFKSPETCNTFLELCGSSEYATKYQQEHPVDLQVSTLCISYISKCSTESYFLFQASMWSSSSNCIYIDRFCPNVILKEGSYSSKLGNPKMRASLEACPAMLETLTNFKITNLKQNKKLRAADRKRIVAQWLENQKTVGIFEYVCLKIPGDDYPAENIHSMEESVDIPEANRDMEEQLNQSEACIQAVRQCATKFCDPAQCCRNVHLCPNQSHQTYANNPENQALT